jgi:hypothetical protein
MIRTLIVWLTLLAVPFQGFASAAMLPCAPAAPAPAMQTAHVHHAMHAMTAHQHDAAAVHAHHDGDKKHSTHHAKCGNCAACCVGAAMFPPQLAGAIPHGALAHVIDFNAGHVPSVDLDLPERPPRFVRA